MTEKFGDYGIGCLDIISDIENAHTIDVERVVRCRDCIYRKDRLYCRLFDQARIVTNMDFCSFGKQKEVK
nr:MAG TPA: hypothetical protein [Caudoviricetes sp.]